MASGFTRSVSVGETLSIQPNKAAKKARLASNKAA
jgi:hypothetical protein